MLCLHLVLAGVRNRIDLTSLIERDGVRSPVYDSVTVSGDERFVAAQQVGLPRLLRAPDRRVGIYQGIDSAHHFVRVSIDQILCLNIVMHHQSECGLAAQQITVLTILGVVAVPKRAGPHQTRVSRPLLLVRDLMHDEQHRLALTER